MSFSIPDLSPFSAEESSFFSKYEKAVKSQQFIKLSLSKNVDKSSDLMNVYVKPVMIKNVYKLSVTYRYKTNDQVKNLSIEESIGVLQHALGASYFQEANLFLADETVKFERKKDGKVLLSSKKTATISQVDLSHNKTKKRVLDTAGKTWMQALQLTDENGEVIKSAQDKFKQINHYIELLSPELQQLKKETFSVVDMGAGKGYLTFALYEYIAQVIKKQAIIKGVELRSDLVSLCNEVAKSSGFTGLSFVEGSIQDTEITSVDVLVALHACDTATDDAIAKGIQSGASLIVVAPCCHKQIRREMEQSESQESLRSMLRFGIFLERQAEMITDAIRALILEKNGYSVKVMQFISDVHTPKNVLITAIKKEGKVVQTEEIQQKIEALKSSFGIKRHYLETLV